MSPENEICNVMKECIGFMRRPPIKILESPALPLLPSPGREEGSVGNLQKRKEKKNKDVNSEFPVEGKLPFHPQSWSPVCKC